MYAVSVHTLAGNYLFMLYDLHQEDSAVAKWSLVKITSVSNLLRCAYHETEAYKSCLYSFPMCKAFYRII